VPVSGCCSECKNDEDEKTGLLLKCGKLDARSGDEFTADDDVGTPAPRRRSRKVARTARTAKTLPPAAMPAMAEVEILPALAVGVPEVTTVMVLVVAVDDIVVVLLGLLVDPAVGVEVGLFDVVVKGQEALLANPSTSRP
jgi:hypothetical protein